MDQSFNFILRMTMLKCLNKSLLVRECFILVCLNSRREADSFPSPHLNRSEKSQNFGNLGSHFK